VSIERCEPSGGDLGRTIERGADNQPRGSVSWIFTINSSGTGDGVILHANNTLVSSTNPARSGEQVVIYGTGLGPKRRHLRPGPLLTAANVTVSPVSVKIGGVSATVRS